MEKIIALDIGQVCLSIHPERCFGALGYRSLDEVPQELLYMESEQFERGMLSEADFLEKFRLLTGSSGSAEELSEIFCAIIGDPLPGMIDLVRSLPRRGFRPVFFSDTSATHMRRVRQKFPAVDAVPEGVFSHEVGAKKSDDAMFEAFEHRFGRPFLYVDDRAELIGRGRARGWKGHVFAGAGDLEKFLENCCN